MAFTLEEKVRLFVVHNCLLEPNSWKYFLTMHHLMKLGSFSPLARTIRKFWDLTYGETLFMNFG